MKYFKIIIICTQITATHMTQSAQPLQKAKSDSALLTKKFNTETSTLMSFIRKNSTPSNSTPFTNNTWPSISQEDLSALNASIQEQQPSSPLRQSASPIQALSPIQQIFLSNEYSLFKLCQKKATTETELFEQMHQAMELLDQGTDPNAHFSGVSLLRTAIAHIQPDLINMLLAYNAQPTEDDLVNVDKRILIYKLADTEETNSHPQSAHHAFNRYNASTALTPQMRYQRHIELKRKSVEDIEFLEKINNLDLENLKKIKNSIIAKLESLKK